MNDEERKEIERHLASIGKILLPFINYVSDDNGYIFRAQLDKYEYGPFLISYLDMLSFLNPEMEEATALKLVYKNESNENSVQLHLK